VIDTLLRVDEVDNCSHFSDLVESRTVRCELDLLKEVSRIILNADDVKLLQRFLHVSTMIDHALFLHSFLPSLPERKLSNGTIFLLSNGRRFLSDMQFQDFDNDGFYNWSDRFVHLKRVAVEGDHSTFFEYQNNIELLAQHIKSLEFQK
jgi:hypothetical protein